MTAPGQPSDETGPGFILVGIVGYTPVVEAFPLGQRLMRGLERQFAHQPEVEIENMTWGPIHIVQRFQDEGARRPDRLVLVGASALCRNPGRVQAYRWNGGKLADSVMQGRIYEAVTGIVDIENTLAIGNHFAVWPQETYTVEVDLAADVFGAMVMAETEGCSSDRELAQSMGFSPQQTTQAILDLVLDLVRNGDAAQCCPVPKSAGELALVEVFTSNEIVGTVH